MSIAPPRPGSDRGAPVDVDHLFEPVEPVPERVTLPAFGTGRRAELRKRGRRHRDPDTRRAALGDPPGEPIDEPVAQPADQASAGEPVDEPIAQLADQISGELVDEPAGEPVDERHGPPPPDVLVPARSRVRMAPRWGAIVVLVALAAAGVIVTGQLSADREGAPATPPGVAAPVPGEAPMATVLVAQDAEGAGALITVLVAHEGGGGAVVYVPTGAMAEIPSFGLEQLGRAVTLGGPELVGAGLENLFGVQMSDVVTVDAASLGDLLGAARLDLVLPDSVEAADEGGRVEVLWPEGAVRLDPAAIAGFLIERGSGTELELLVRHKVFWQALLAAIADGSGSAGGELASLGPVLESLAAGDVAHHTLPVEALGSDGEGAGLYRVDRTATAALVERTMAGAPALDADARTRIQILNGTGEPGLAREVTVALVPAGAEVVVVDNADRFDYELTQIVYYDRDERARAEQVRDALGTGEVVLSRNRLDVVDVTVVVGRDFTG